MSNNNIRHREKINYDKTFDCVQCGYCLPACPTYQTMEKETHSPRGRINLVKMYAEGKISAEDLQEPIEKCLGCQACTTICPTNVEYGRILEGAKTVLEEELPKTKKQNVVENVIFNKLFPSAKWMDWIGDASWFYQSSGMQILAQKLNLTSVAPLNLDQFEQVLPDLPSPVERRKRENHQKPAGVVKAKVAFFTGCIMDSIFFKTNKNSVDLLVESGAEVILPKAQTCCGALHAHSGKIGDAKELAKRNIETFEQEGVDYIVNNAGGCGAHLIEYHHLFDDEPEWQERAQAFVEKVRDISQVLVELDGLQFTNEVNEVITYQPSCHMTNVQKVIDPPYRLLKKLPGVTFNELEDPNFCCGSAGIYNILNYEDSMDVLEVKMDDVRQVKPKLVVTTNPGCLLQMNLGIKKDGMEDRMRAVHLVDLLVEAGAQGRL
ncbi:(Fe-S)-binding protein [Texcoconibacillus texcoconensis]|uniref:Glycolate oxidase iron-sulfur subunit n=1 Tax=Texcoconibacillus texcoconensis TaxID=1095777 RepID=A0A840QLY6_9BACI|nr:(Fe-S)-binding protein [Texcoconibacillus texcoconensis]MBB5172373.1 glycolate oxidase iron-sulfur subunit [Texcoconibacillus texcoconensis]